LFFTVVFQKLRPGGAFYASTGIRKYANIVCITLQATHVGLTTLSFLVSFMSNKSPGLKNETVMSFLTFLCVYIYVCAILYRISSIYFCDEIVFMLNNVMNIKQREINGNLNNLNSRTEVTIYYNWCLFLIEWKSNNNLTMDLITIFIIGAWLAVFGSILFVVVALYYFKMCIWPLNLLQY